MPSLSASQAFGAVLDVKPASSALRVAKQGLTSQLYRANTLVIAVIRALEDDRINSPPGGVLLHDNARQGRKLYKRAKTR